MPASSCRPLTQAPTSLRAFLRSLNQSFRDGPLRRPKQHFQAPPGARCVNKTTMLYVIVTGGALAVAPSRPDGHAHRRAGAASPRQPGRSPAHGRAFGTPGRGLSSGTTSASLSHRPADLPPILLQELVTWTLPPRRCSCALFTARPPTPSRRPPEQNEEQADDFFGDQPRVSGRPLSPPASLRARAP